MCVIDHINIQILADLCKKSNTSDVIPSILTLYLKEITMTEPTLYLPKHCIVPLNIREDLTIPDAVKIYYGELNVLSNKFGYCFAYDEQLAKMKGKSVATIERWNKILRKKCYIRCETKNVPYRKEKRLLWRAERKIHILDGPVHNISEPSHSENVHNSVDNSVHNSSKKDSEPSRMRGPMGTLTDEGLLSIKQETRNLEHEEDSEVVVQDENNIEDEPNVLDTTHDSLDDAWREKTPSPPHTPTELEILFLEQDTSEIRISDAAAVLFMRVMNIPEKEIQLFITKYTCRELADAIEYAKIQAKNNKIKKNLVSYFAGILTHGFTRKDYD